MASKFENGDLFRNIISSSRDCAGIACGNCAFNTRNHCGAAMLRALMAKFDGASELEFRIPYSDEELIEFIRRNNPAVKKESGQE